jgi:hypothetical protein
MRALRKRIAAAHRPLPPLAEAGHVGVVQSHLLINSVHCPASRANTNTQLRLLPSYKTWPKSTGLLESPGPH